MKLSIAWIFDHIDAPYHQIDIAQLVTLFNQKVAEIEAFYPVHIPLKELTLAKVTRIDDNAVHAHSDEWGTDMALPKRSDVAINAWYLVRKTNDGYRWATAADVGGSNESLSAMHVAADETKGAWKERIAENDYIFELDNKSVTHRPDMWGYRGVAREVALLLDLPLKPIDQMIKTLSVNSYETKSAASDALPFTIAVQEPTYVKRFAAAYFSHVHNGASLPWIAVRLAKSEQRPIDVLVDMTNYVMLDMGQPAHAFDAERITTKTIAPRFAQAKETLTLLDGQDIKLTDKDIVITDGKQPIALAGVMGGAATAVHAATHAILLEAANFDATTIRETATRHKKRTESSARFEKSIDPEQTVKTIERFAQLLSDAGMAYGVSAITSIGAPTPEHHIHIAHTYITDRLGVEIASAEIVRMLTALGCQVTLSEKDGQTLYDILVPSWRSTKDLTIKEDIVEEVGRIYGYTNMPFALPKKQTIPSDLRNVYQVRHIKRQLAFASAMREVHNYAFYDEAFLRECQWRPDNAVKVQNPVSEHWQYLVTSLVPHLLKNVMQNHAQHATLRFFEWARIWQQGSKAIKEETQLAGIFYAKEPFSFYQAKAELQKLTAALHLPLRWERVDAPTVPWFMPYQTATLWYEDQCIGMAGTANQAFTHTLFEGHAFIFTLDGTFLANYRQPEITYAPASKYPSIDRDMSMMVPLQVSVAQITDVIAKASPLIREVTLVDLYQKDEWHDQKSCTFRFVVQDEHKTLTKQEADTIWDAVATSLKAIGAQIR